MLQVAKQTCGVVCKNNINNITIIVIGGSGDISIAQECKIDNVQCILKNTFDVQIENILESMVKQSASSMNGFSLDFANISLNVDLYQYIQNTITQMTDNSCKFEASNEITGAYIYVQDHKGNVSISQNASITNASCNMDNIAKAVTYNSISQKTDQQASIVNIFSLIIVAVIVAIIGATIVLIVFVATGGVASIAGAAGGASGGGGKAGTKGGGGGSLLSKGIGFIEANPELLL